MLSDREREELFELAAPLAAGQPHILGPQESRRLAALIDLAAEHREVVILHWSTRHGRCYDCGLPAAFALPDAYGDAYPPGEVHKRCAVCAANAAAEGERVTRIDQPEEQ